MHIIMSSRLRNLHITSLLNFVTAKNGLHWTRKKRAPFIKSVMCKPSPSA
jgi:hypothetical protein